MLEDYEKYISAMKEERSPYLEMDYKELCKKEIEIKEKIMNVGKEE